MSPEDAAAICREEPGFVWLGMVEPSPEELAQMQETLRPARARRRGRPELPPAARRSSSTRTSVSFVVLRTARYDDEREEVEFGEISVFIGPSFVITVRQGVASDLHGARLRLEQRPELLEEGTGAVLWAILDKVVDDYAPVVEGLERDIEEVEHTVFSRRRRADRAHLPPAPRGDRLLPRRPPAAGPVDALERGQLRARRRRRCASTSATSATTSSSSTRRSPPSATC